MPTVTRPIAAGGSAIGLAARPDDLVWHGSVLQRGLQFGDLGLDLGFKVTDFHGAIDPHQGLVSVHWPVATHVFGIQQYDPGPNNRVPSGSGDEALEGEIPVKERLPFSHPVGGGLHLPDEEPLRMNFDNVGDGEQSRCLEASLNDRPSSSQMGRRFARGLVARHLGQVQCARKQASREGFYLCALSGSEFKHCIGLQERFGFTVLAQPCSSAALAPFNKEALADSIHANGL